MSWPLSPLSHGFPLSGNPIGPVGDKSVEPLVGHSSRNCLFLFAYSTRGVGKMDIGKFTGACTGYVIFILTETDSGLTRDSLELIYAKCPVYS